MEEDIKNLQEIISLSEEEIKNNDENITAILDLEDLKALQNLLTRYKQLELENQALKNNQANCPVVNTSGFKCKLKESED